MEKIIDKSSSLIDENEKIIANILHDIKSPLYSIKIGLASKLDSELHQDIYETTVDTINYIENFLLNYNFKKGKYENKISECNIKNIIYEKLKNYKYIFANKNIHVDFLYNSENFTIHTIAPFVSSIIGNLISNIAIHSKENKHAIIEISRKQDIIVAQFCNQYNASNSNSALGLCFCQNLAKYAKIDIDYIKNTKEVKVSLGIPDISCQNQH